MNNDLLEGDIEVLRRHLEIQSDRWPEALTLFDGILKDRKQAYENLTLVQKRCTDLIQLVRKQTLTELAEDVRAGKSRSYVEAAQALSRYALDGTPPE